MKDPALTPEWVKDLIIYEIATKGFTSPAGPESGTFNSLSEKLPYLADLGVNALWLTGHNWADDHHFYNIWTQYATIRPDVLDPSLGTPADFKALLEAAHGHGLRVFLDVITHGVMAGSPLIAQHPDWFRGGSWGMVDYDWTGNHPDLDDWWVGVWTNYVTEYGVDGYRLDVNIYRPDLWRRIKQNCAAAGRPIVVIDEGHQHSDDVADLYQASWGLYTGQWGPSEWHPSVLDVAGWFDHRQRLPNHYEIQLDYADGEVYVASTLASQPGGAELPVKRWLLPNPYLDSASNSNAENRNKPQFGGELPLQLLNLPPYRPGEAAQDLPPLQVVVSGIDPQRAITRLVAVDECGSVWRFTNLTDNRLSLSGAAALTLTLEVKAPDLLYASHQLSSHDSGWMGFPLDQSAYVAKGRRWLFGYSFMLVPSIPLFMGGEEFNADYVPLPGHSPNLFGTDQAGQGRWLYASMLDWGQLEQPDKQAFLADVKRLIALRKAESDLIHGYTNGSGQAPPILPVPFLNDQGVPNAPGVPQPYLLWNAKKALLVAGNPQPAAELALGLALPLEQTALGSRAEYLVSDLWSGKPTVKMTAVQLQRFRFTIPPDQSPGGGLAVFKIVPV